jgi:uncharacterized protein
MAYKAKDGKRFANHQAGRYYDNVKNPVAAEEAKGEPQQEPDGDEGGEQPIEDVVAQHGPAHATHIQKDEGEDGSYSVHSEHEDGHKHSSHGHDIHSAHKHSLKAHGADEESQDEQEPEGGERMPSMISEG